MNRSKLLKEINVIRLERTINVFAYLCCLLTVFFLYFPALIAVSGIAYFGFILFLAPICLMFYVNIKAMPINYYGNDGKKMRGYWAIKLLLLTIPLLFISSLPLAVLGCILFIGISLEIFKKWAINNHKIATTSHKFASRKKKSKFRWKVAGLFAAGTAVCLIACLLFFPFFMPSVLAASLAAKIITFTVLIAAITCVFLFEYHTRDKYFYYSSGKTSGKNSININQEDGCAKSRELATAQHDLAYQKRRDLTLAEGMAWTEIEYTP